jgi:hypothetical protein
MYVAFIGFNGPCHTITGISILRWHFTNIFLKMSYVAVILKHSVVVAAAAASQFGVCSLTRAAKSHRTQ